MRVWKLQTPQEVEAGMGRTVRAERGWSRDAIGSGGGRLWEGPNTMLRCPAYVAELATPGEGGKFCLACAERPSGLQVELRGPVMDVGHREVEAMSQIGESSEQRCQEAVGSPRWPTERHREPEEPGHTPETHVWKGG